MKYTLENTGEQPEPWKLSIEHVSTGFKVKDHLFAEADHALNMIHINETVLVPLAEKLAHLGIKPEDVEHIEVRRHGKTSPDHSSLVNPDALIPPGQEFSRN